MENIKFETKFSDPEGEIIVIELSGQIDQSNSYQLQKIFDDVIQSGAYRVIVDFKDLYYISSAGWGIFIGEIKRFREKGGDIKLANMNPDIYDVFQMLEFYHILEDYPTVEDAAAAFKGHGDLLDLVDEDEEEDTSIPESPVNIEEEEVDIKVDDEEAEEMDTISMGLHISQPAQPIEDKKEITDDGFLRKIKHEVKLSNLPLPEKIKKVVAEDPMVGVWGIRKILRNEHFGNTKIGIIKLWRLLRELDLDTKEKRYRYYRSC